MDWFRILAFALLSSTLQLSLSAQPGGLAESYYHFSLAKMHEFNKDFEAAISEYEKTLNLYADENWVRLEYARALWNAGRMSKAIDECGVIIEKEPENVEARYLLAQIYSGFRGQEGMREKAVAEFRRILEINPEHFESFYYLGQLYLNEEEFPEAAEAFGRFIELRPDLVEGYYRKGVALSEMDRREQAIEVLEEGLENLQQAPDSYWELLATLYLRVDQEERAIEVYRRSLETSSSPALKRALAQLLLKAGKAEEAVPLFREVASNFPREEELQVELGKALRETRQFSEAAAILRRAAEQRPLDLEAHYELALSLEGMGERQEAIEKLKYLIEIADSHRFHSALKTRLALLYQSGRQFEPAVALLREVIEENSADFYAQLRLFYALLDASRNQEAEQLSRDILKRFPEEPRSAVARAQILARQGKLAEGVRLLTGERERSQPEEFELFTLAISQLYLESERLEDAAATLQAALSDRPDSRQLRFQLGAVYERQQQYELAEDEFQRILKEDPEDAAVLNYLGYMLADRGIRLAEAQKYIEKAVELDPYNGAYLDSLGWVHYQSGNLEKAEEFLKKAFQINQFDSTIAEHLGDLYQKQGQTERARHFYETSIALAEKDAEHERVGQKLTKLNRSIKQD